MTFSSTVDRQGGAVIFTPSGWVDAAVVETFTSALIAAAREAKDAEALIVDLSQLAYMVSRGLRALTMAQREGATVKLARPNEQMSEILSISRYDKLFEVVA